MKLLSKKRNLKAKLKSIIIAKEVSIKKIGDKWESSSNNECREIDCYVEKGNKFNVG